LDLGGLGVDVYCAVLESVRGREGGLYGGGGGGEGEEERTRMQMLQLHSWMSPLYEERGPEVFNARVMAPQWQLPV
jgi:hypothetical protein